MNIQIRLIQRFDGSPALAPTPPFEATNRQLLQYYTVDAIGHTESLTKDRSHLTERFCRLYNALDAMKDPNRFIFDYQIAWTALDLYENDCDTGA